jgi:hypothetical protein
MEVKIVSSVKSGKYKSFLENAEILQGITKSRYNWITRFINLPKNIEIIFRPIHMKYGRALVYKDGDGFRYVVEIDIRQGLSDFYDTLIHELVHIEQFFEGRLSVNSDSDFFVWEGKKVMPISTTETELYNNLPWEKEAIERAAILVKKVF